MLIRKKWSFTNEKGLTLVEILASLVILTILIVTFMTMFIQSAKTNKASDRLIDSTYIAQVEMENIYGISQDTFDKRLAMEEKLGYELKGEIYEKLSSDKHITVTLKDREDDLTNVVVKVYNNEIEDKLEAQMETILSWGADSN